MTALESIADSLKTIAQCMVTQTNIAKRAAELGELSESSRLEFLSLTRDQIALQKKVTDAVVPPAEDWSGSTEDDGTL